MNAQQKYLAWLRITAPEVYSAAIRKVSGAKRGSGGLSRDLIGSMYAPTTGFGHLGDDLEEFDITNFKIPDDIPISSYSPPDLSTQFDTNPINFRTPEYAPPPIDSGSGGGFDWASAITKAVAGIGTTVLQTAAQGQLLKINTTRAQQGLPPVDKNGVPIRTTALPASTNPTLRAMEASVGGMMPLALIAGVGLLAIVLLKRK